MYEMSNLEIFGIACANLFFMFLTLAIATYLADFIIQPLIDRRKNNQRKAAGNPDPINRGDADPSPGRPADER